MERILLATKFRFIGDTLLAVPLIRAVRAQWPHARIVLLTGCNARALLENNPYLDEIIEFDPRGRDRGTAQFLRLVARLRRACFDACFVLNRSFHSALIPALAHIRLRAGFASEGRTWLLSRPVPYDPDKSEIDCYFDVLRAVAPQVPTDPALALWISDSEHAEARRHLQEAWGENIPPTRLVGIQPGASLPEKRWPAARFACLADALVQSDPKARIVLLGGPDERAAADAMLEHCAAQTRIQARDFVGRFDLRGSLALLAQLGLFVGSDTAILHSANALGIPTVALFGPTNPRKWGAPAPHRLVLEAADGAMESLSTDDVIQAARLLRPVVAPAPLG
jgi:heptosyltransferase-2